MNATISGRQLTQVSQLPRSALRSDGSVMIVDARQRAQVRQVQLLRSNGNQVWVQGLEDGERVIVREPTLVVAGMEVSVNNVAELASDEVH